MAKRYLTGVRYDSPKTIVLQLCPQAVSSVEYPPGAPKVYVVYSRFEGRELGRGSSSNLAWHAAVKKLRSERGHNPDEPIGWPCRGAVVFGDRPLSIVIKPEK